LPRLTLAAAMPSLRCSAAAIAGPAVASIELRTNTFGQGPASYCGHCLILRLPGFEGWLVAPDPDPTSHTE